MDFEPELAPEPQTDDEMITTALGDQLGAMDFIPFNMSSHVLCLMCEDGSPVDAHICDDCYYLYYVT